MEDPKFNNVYLFILRIAVGSLAFICISVVLVLLYAFFDDAINNDQIFEVIGPAFNMIVGAFVGLLGGISLRSGGK